MHVHPTNSNKRTIYQMKVDMRPGIFHTLRTKLLLIFSVFTLITTIVSVYCYSIYQARERSSEFKNMIHSNSSKILLLSKIRMQFLLYDAKNNFFYKTSENEYLQKNDQLFETIDLELDELSKNNNNIIPEQNLIKLKSELKEYQKDYNFFVLKLHERGFRDFGLEGQMRKYIHDVETYQDSINMVLLLTVRRNEKDYILRKDENYISLHTLNTDVLREEILNDAHLSEQGKWSIVSLLDQYKTCFDKWVIVDKELGLDQGNGLSQKMKKHDEAFETITNQLVQISEQNDDNLGVENKQFFISAIILSIILSIVLSFLFSNSFTRPIRELSNSIKAVVKSNFSANVNFSYIDAKSEMGQLIMNFIWMNNQIHAYIQEVKENEKNLEEKEKKFRALIENSNDAIALTDAKGKITYASPSTSRIIGYEPEELLGRTTNDLVHPDDVGNLIIQFAEVTLSQGAIVYIQFRILHKDGSWRWVDGYSANLLHEPNIQSIITNYRDITSRKNSELKIDEQYKELQLINSELDRFVYSASHDLKAPLASILGMVLVSKLEPSMDAKLSYMDMIDASVRKLLDVIKDLTDFSRNARLEIQHEKIDFKEIIQESILSYSHIKNFSEINFDIKADESTVFYSDALRLKTLFNNLISNAILYHCIDQSNPYILLEVKNSFTHVEIRVKDNGRGIDEKFHSKIFDMFYRASEDSMGTGLGLYIVKGIIEKLNGSIQLISTPGQGSEFVIELPNIALQLQEVTSQKETVKQY
ncbi:MAG: PAS domain S-box protein [Cytophagaceae bacterium]|nr:PAS domain S-box protein [Cytophagaceae bacterium]